MPRTCDPEIKRCPKCGVTYPRTAEHFTRDRTRYDGLCGYCKKCELSKTNHTRSRGMRRFIRDEGVRFLKNGKVRCQAVTKKGMREERAKHPGEKLSTNKVFPLHQCAKAAIPGSYYCKFHGGNRLGRREDVIKNVKEITKYLTKGLADKYIQAKTDEELFNQRDNVAILTARNLELLENIQTSGLTSDKRLKQLNKGLSLIHKGDIKAGADTIEEVVDSLHNEKGAWAEFRENARVIKDLSNAEMNRRKEMRQYMTAEQVLAKMDDFTQRLLDAIEKEVDDPMVLDGVYRTVLGEVRGITGTPGAAILPQDTSEN